MSTHVYNIGDLVDRIEDREVTGAKVIAIQAHEGMETSVHLEYDEGGDGWWPVSAIKPKDTSQ